MTFNFKYIENFNFKAVFEFATIGLFKQKKLVMELLILFLILISAIIFFGLICVSVVAFSYLFFTPDLIIFSIIPLLFLLLFLVVMIITGVYFSYRIVSFALGSIGKKVQKFSIRLALKLILSGIVSFLVALFSLYELKLLLIGIAGVILLLISLALIIFSNFNFLMIILGFLVIFVSIILLFIYYIVLIRNMTRISFARILIIEKNLGVRESVKNSWNLTAGKAVLIFLIQFIFVMIIAAIEQILMFSMNILSIPFTFSFNLILLGMFMLIFVILFAVIMVISELIIVFEQVAVYNQITLKKK